MGILCTHFRRLPLMGEGSKKQVSRKNNEKNSNCLAWEREDSVGNNMITIMHYHSHVRSPLILKVISRCLGVHMPDPLPENRTDPQRLSFYSKVQSKTGTNEETYVTISFITDYWNYYLMALIFTLASLFNVLTNLSGDVVCLSLLIIGYKTLLQTVHTHLRSLELKKFWVVIRS